MDISIQLELEFEDEQWNICIPHIVEEYAIYLCSFPRSPRQGFNARILKPALPSNIMPCLAQKYQVKIDHQTHQDSSSSEHIQNAVELINSASRSTLLTSMDGRP